MYILILSRGPSWIHGTLTNPILSIAKKTETTLCLNNDNACVFDQTGKTITTEKATAFFDIVWCTISDAFKYSNDNCSNISPKTSLKDFFLEKALENGIIEDDQTLIFQMAEVWGGFIGDPWDKQSLKYFWLEECLDGGGFPQLQSYTTLRLHGAILARFPLPETPEYGQLLICNRESLCRRHSCQNSSEYS